MGFSFEHSISFSRHFFGHSSRVAVTPDHSVMATLLRSGMRANVLRYALPRRGTSLARRTFLSASRDNQRQLMTARSESLLTKHTSATRFPKLRRFSSNSTEAAVEADACFAKAGEPVAWWLCGCAGMVATIVAVGGLTRLTRSGLSMVDWKPHGGLPPQGDKEWQEEFEKYKLFPEYQRSDKSMTLKDFKFIYHMEWGHRMLGRAVGVVFILPAIVFAARGRITGRLARRCVALAGLGAAQGAIGWWMVKSGLAEELLVHSHEPRVSPYRLTVHLTMAFSLYAGLVWTATDIFRTTRPHLTRLAKDAVASVDFLAALKKLRKSSHMAAGFIGLTAVAGALVAGNDAGYVDNLCTDFCNDRC